MISEQIKRRLHSGITALRKQEIQWAFAAFTSVFLIQALIIKHFGVNIPFWDEWSEIWLFNAFQQHDPSAWLTALFVQHNEHRIVVARLVFVLLYNLLGEWNLWSQMLFSGMVLGIYAAVWAYTLHRLHVPGWVAILSCLLLTSVVQWENVVWGFQVQFYVLLCATVITVCSIVLRRRIDWVLIALVTVLGVVATFSVASGVFVWGIAELCLLIRVWFEKQSLQLLWADRMLLLKIAVPIGVAVVCGLLYIRGYQSVPNHAVLKAHTVAQAVAWFVTALNYPLLETVNWITVALACVQWAIISAGLLLYIRQIQQPLIQKKIVLVVGMLLFVGINAATTAYSRGATVGGMPSRYGTMFLWTSIVFFVVANDVLQLTLVRSRRWLMVAALLFACIGGVWLGQVQRALTSLEVAAQVKADRLQLGDTLFAELRDLNYVVTGIQPVPSPPILQLLQTDPNSRSHLPHWIQAQIMWPLAAQTRGDAWIAGWGAPGSPSPYLGWGSWHGDANPTATGQLQSVPLTVTQSLLVLPVAGYPTLANNALMIEAVDLPDLRIMYQGADPGPTWKNWYVDVSALRGHPVRIVAIDGNPTADGWLAFKNPWQISYLSLWIDRFLAHLELIIAFLFISCIGVFILRSAKVVPSFVERKANVSEIAYNTVEEQAQIRDVAHPVEIRAPHLPGYVHATPTHTDDTVISVSNVSKMYQIYERPQDRLKQMLLWRFGKTYGRPFWALEDVSFDVKRGETIGIIGRNGSGKSTLLQIIAGTLAPTTGEVQVHGRIAALLELGSGFNPEFTGRENVFMNGAILGVERDEMARRFDDIAAFADIGDFIDQPVKTYSSGMQARLAFAVGIHVDPDIFIIDEALSVGDIFFQSRCARKLDEYRQQGGTVLFVTHDTYTLERICTRSIVLHQGQKCFEGPNADAANFYYQLERGGELPAVEEMVQRPSHMAETVELRRDYVTGDGTAYIKSISIQDEFGRDTTTFHVGEWMNVLVMVQFHRDLDSFDYGIGVRDRLGVLIGGAHTFHQQQSCGTVRAGEHRVLTARIQLSITPGNYLLLVGVVRNYAPYDWEDFYTMWDCCSIQVVGTPPFWGQAQLHSFMGEREHDR